VAIQFAKTDKIKMSFSEMWKIELLTQCGTSAQKNANLLNRLQKKSIEIFPDDISFLAILKRGPTIHMKNKISLVRCSHIIEAETTEKNILYYQFYMSILEASKIEIRNDTFLNDGIMGKWKFVFDAKQKIPKIKLVQSYTNIYDFFKEACGVENPEWIRNTFKKYMELVEAKDTNKFSK
jgi:hypothetical protein